MRSVAARLVLALLAGGCIGVTTDSQAPIDISAPGTWTVLAAMPTARQEVAVAALDGAVWVIGGFGPGAEPVGTVEVYDPVTNRWQARPPLPAPVHHAAAGVVGSRLFVVGGYTGGRVRWTAIQTVFEWDGARNSWATRAPMPTPRGGLAVAVLGGRLHALGGSAEELSPAHEIYEPATDRWRGASPMPTARDHLTAVAFQGHVWAIGGRASFFGTQFASVEVYDPATDRWRAAPPLPTARGGLAAAALSDRILVFGGEAPFRIFNAVEMYEVAGNRWIGKTPMPTPRHGIGAAVVGARVYLPGGGREPGFAATDVNEVYAP
ncbi:MAG: Kelch repeat-containing protein [Candidatus Rokuibacteriota bacterium]